MLNLEQLELARLLKQIRLYNKMVDPISISGLNFFIPIAAFLFVFTLVYALLAKSEILGENSFVHFLISFVLAVFFVIEVSLVDFVQISSAWFAVFLVCVFLILILVGMTHGKLDDIQKPWLAWVLGGVVIGIFIVSAAYTFHWAVGWSVIQDWFYTDWFGMVLLFAVAIVAAIVLTWKVKE